MIVFLEINASQIFLKNISKNLVIVSMSFSINQHYATFSYLLSLFASEAFLPIILIQILT